jgi:hypothetical protein
MHWTSKSTRKLADELSKKSFVCSPQTTHANIYSWFDQVFATYKPSWRGTTVRCGLEGPDEPLAQTRPALLPMPFRWPSKQTPNPVRVSTASDYT